MRVVQAGGQLCWWLALALMVAPAAFAQPAGVSARRERASGLVRRAEAYLSSGDLISALGYFRDAISADPRLDAAYDGLGRLYLQKGSVSEALQVYERGLRVRPDAARLVVGLARAYGASGQGPRAAQVLRRFVARFPEAAEVQQERAQVAERAGHWAEALDAHRAIVALHREGKWQGDVKPHELRANALSLLVRELDPVSAGYPCDPRHDSPVRRALAGC